MSSSIKVSERPPTLDALRLTADNTAEMAAFVGFYFRPPTETSAAGIYDPSGAWVRPLPVGSWVVLTPTAAQILTDVEFHARYVQAS